MVLVKHLALAVLVAAYASAVRGLRAQPDDEPEASRIRSDETVVFFPTYGVRTDDGWRLNIHGWIYEAEADSLWRKQTIEAFGRAIGLTDQELDAPLFLERARRFVADNERGKRIAISVAGHRHILPASSANGHFQGEIHLTEAQAASVQESRVTLSAENASEDAVAMAGEAFLLHPRGLTVVCDIDDTIKISDVSDHDKLLRRTFAQPYEPVPKMADLLGRLSAGGADVHYLSASPWQLYEPLSGFLRDHGFPHGPMTLRSFRLKDETALNMLADPGAYKREALNDILDAFPDRRFVLIGDSTEDDAEVFADAATNDRRIIFIAIRAVPGDDAGEQRARDALSTLAEQRWTLFTNPASVRAELIVQQPAAPPPDRPR